jgi:phage terminase large subunit GpA-like protein
MTNTPLILQLKSTALETVIKHVENWKTSSYIEMPSEWAAENRYLPAGTTEYPGLVDHSIAPHMVEILDCFHPDSGLSQISIMKSTQSLATTTIESAIGHAVKHKLHNILYIISSKNIAKVRSSAAIDVMIDNSGLAGFVKPISERMKRKTADNTFYKELHGGRRLMMTSWNSIGDAKSLTWSFIIMDEIDEAPYELKGQGDPEKIFAGRGKTVRNLKIAKISTPTTTTGRIAVNFYEGDQRYFYVPCPHCGEFQTLEVKGAGKDYGLTASSERIDGVEQIVPESVCYICKHCKALFYEYQKSDMMLKGKWIPTARPVNPGYRSYHISNLMSPVMFYTWTRCMQEFAETDWGQNITRFKNFCIDVLGMPWESRSEKKDWSELQTAATDYALETIPAGGLIVTAGVDVQKTWLEFQAVAWGKGLECWIVDHRKFYGETYDLNNNCWQELRKYIMQKKYNFAGYNQAVTISCTAIDSGYNPKAAHEEEAEQGDITTEHIVYSFVASTPRTIACRGNDSLKDAFIRKETVKKAQALKIRYDVAVSELKDEIFTHLDMPAGTPGQIHFTKKLSQEYFRGFSSEVYAEIAPGKWNWKKIYDRNEPLDTFILCRAAAEMLNLPSWTEQVWDKYKSSLKL